MSQSSQQSRFKAQLLRPASPGSYVPWSFLVLPQTASAKLPRRGRTSIEGSINGHRFQAMLEPDGQLSHWLPISKELLEAAGANIGDVVELEIRPVAEEPEPQIPSDLQDALADSPGARMVWDETTTLGRVDWVHWIVSAKQAKTRTQRIENAGEMLASGKKRVCCFDPSGYYSKALSAPKAAG